MQMQLFGVVLLISACGGFGLWTAARVRRRPRELKDIMTALTLLDTEIFWGLTPLPEAFAMLKTRVEKPWDRFFSELEERLKNGESAGEAWRNAISRQRDCFCLKEEDWNLVQDVGKGLGRSDRREQHKQLELILGQLRLLKERSSNWADKQAKLWSYLGFVAGIAGAIIMI